MYYSMGFWMTRLMDSTLMDSCLGIKGDAGIPGTPGSPGAQGLKGSMGEMGLPGQLFILVQL